MRWTLAEKQVFYELWGEEPFPRGWRRAREWMAEKVGQDRALARWSCVVVGGDATLATLALRAHARQGGARRALWVPDRDWSHTPFLWTAEPGTAEELGARLGRTTPSAMGALLAEVRTNAFARLAQGGGAWARCERQLFDAPVDSGRVCVLKPRGLRGPGPVPHTPFEQDLERWWAEMAAASPRWASGPVAMVGGVADEVWLLTQDPAQKEWTKCPNIRDFSLAVSPDMPISVARSQWWDSVEALIAAARP